MTMMGYIIFTMVSLGLVVVEATLPASTDSERLGRDWFGTIYFGAHILYINPLVTLLNFFAPVLQLCGMLLPSHNTPSVRSALSVKTCRDQAILFFLLAAYWPFRIRFRGGGPYDESFLMWFIYIGWPSVNAALFALQQTIFWIVAKKKMKIKRLAYHHNEAAVGSEAQAVDADESTPLHVSMN
jgi:hypothetical protein